MNYKVERAREKIAEARREIDHEQKRCQHKECTGLYYMEMGCEAYTRTCNACGYTLEAQCGYMAWADARRKHPDDD